MDMEPVKPANPTAVRFKKGGKLFHPHQFFPAGEQTAFGHEKPFMFDVCIFTVKVCCSLARMEQMLLDMEGFMCVKMKVVAHLNGIGTDMRIGKVRADDRLVFFQQRGNFFFGNLDSSCKLKRPVHHKSLPGNKMQIIQN